jgi:hypothetical protein
LPGSDKIQAKIDELRNIISMLTKMGPITERRVRLKAESEALTLYDALTIINAESAAKFREDDEDKILRLADLRAKPLFGEKSQQASVRDEPMAFYDTVPDMVGDFNRFFIQVLIGNQPNVIWEHDNKYTIFSYEQFHKQFSYVRIVNGNKGDGKATKMWLDSYNKRSVPGIKFWPSLKAIDPNDPKNRLFNTWRDWTTKPVENKGLWKIILRHIYEVICNGSITKTNHYLNFYAHLLQRPEQKPSFGLATRGDEEGTGKSMVAEEMMKIIGRDNTFSTADPEDIFGKNNPGMDNCLLLLLEEVEWALYRRYTNKFRHLFTTPILNINDKYEKQIVQNNFTRIIINGNADHIMQVSRTGRRLSIWDVNPKYIGNIAYFANVKETFDHGGREALMYYLLHRDISKFDPFKPLHTKELDEQKELSLNAVGSFWLEYLEEAQLPYDELVNVVDGFDQENGKVVGVKYKVIVEKLVWCFNTIQKRNGVPQLSTKAFGRQLRKFVPEMPPAWSVKCSTEWVGEQLNCFEIKDLKTCREYFVANQYWKNKEWNNAKEFKKLDVDRHLWYKGW